MRDVLRRVLLGVVAVLGVAMLWTVLVLLSVRGDLTAARDDLKAAREGDRAAAVRAELIQARNLLEGATSALRQPGPRLVAHLPIAGRTVAAVSDTAGATLSAVRAAEALLAAAPAQLQEDGRLDVDALRTLAQVAKRESAASRGPIARLTDLELSLVPGAVARPAREARTELHALPRSLDRTAAALRGISDIVGAETPRSLLVMLENNAELRGTGGLVTVFAQATAEDGRIAIDAFRDVVEVADPPEQAERVPAPADYRELWGPFLADTTLWLSTNMTPDVPTASAVLANVAQASGLRRPDAVLWFDVRAIAALLEVTGPVQLPGGRVLNAENAVPLLLSQAYQEADDTTEGQADRRDELRAAADAVLGRLLRGEGPAPDIPELASALAAAADGRHLAVWSARAATQRDLLAGGIAGAVDAAGGDLSSFTVQNFGGGDRQGNKLDYYARRLVSVRAVVDTDAALVTQEVTLRNTAPAAGLPTYVAGGVEPGTSRNYITMALPAQAHVLEFSRAGRPLPQDVHREGDHLVMTDAASLTPGAETTWRLRYRLPLRDGHYTLRLVPQPLAVDAGMNVVVSAAAGQELRGRGAENGQWYRSAAFASTTVVDVAAEPPGVLARTAAAVRRFWTEPVRLPD